GADCRVTGGELRLITPNRVGSGYLPAGKNTDGTQIELVRKGQAFANPSAVLESNVADISNRSVQVLPQNDINDAGDGVGPVERGLASWYDFDPIDKFFRDTRDVDDDVLRVIKRRIVGHRSPVNEVLQIGR